jgi:hypothetical protein
MSERVSEADNHHKNDGYEEFEQSVTTRLASFGDDPLFTTDASNLWNMYLEGLPEADRQHYNCHACRTFIERYGGLVVIDEGGQTHSAIWGNNIPALFQRSVLSLINAAMKAKVTGVFLYKDKVLGTPVTGQWTHLSAINARPFQSSLRSAGEKMAEKKADFILLKTSMSEYPIAAIDQALLLLKTDALYRAEKVLGIAEWFKALHEATSSQKNGKLRDNLIWKAVALAPPGYCHVKNTMIGTLLDDIVSGMGFDQASARFAAKMHPLQYQRPQAAPSQGNIEQAEKIVEKLKIARSLVRRFARLDEIQAIWKPQAAPEVASGEGVFSHLTPKGSAPTTAMDMPPMSITWRKFSEEVLPEAISMSLLVRYRDNFTAILTAEHIDAPPILQWDSIEKRNPCSWYVYSGGSHADQWGLVEGHAKVTAICYKPSLWQEGNEHQGKGLAFVLEGAKDSKKNQGNALFPEILKADLREIRSTIEAYSRSAEILGYEDASACGLAWGGKNETAILKVTTKLGTAAYKLDRWD